MFSDSNDAFSTSYVFCGKSTNIFSKQPFQVKFLTAAIKICAGCRKGYARAEDGKASLPRPFDLCSVHREQHLYYNVENCKQQLSSLSNVHYHANVSCPKARFSDFNPQQVEVPDDVHQKLNPSHCFRHLEF